MTNYINSNLELSKLNWQSAWFNSFGNLDIIFNNTLKHPYQSYFQSMDLLLNETLEYIKNNQNGYTIKNYFGQPINFVSQRKLPANLAYETFIAKTGQIPTRDNFHDLLNGLIWLNFPKAKAMFNYLHAQDIKKHGVTGVRTPLRNMLTVFDENGGLVVSSDKKILSALQKFDWLTALWDNRKSWLKNKQENNTVAFFPIGHALLEKLMQPRLAICGHTLLVLTDDNFFKLTTEQQRQILDSWLAQFFMQYSDTLGSKSFQPLPILGIPDFYSLQNKEFYQNTSVFRPQNNRKPIQILTLSTKDR